MSLSDPREHQMFPVLTAAQIATASRFSASAAVGFAPGADVFSIGERGGAAWLVLEGTIDAARNDGLRGTTAITTHRVGQFTGEVSQLAGRSSLVRGKAGAEGCLAIPFDPASLRALVVGSAEVGEIVMRAFILRRVGLIDTGGAGPVLIGAPGTADVLRLQGFLTRGGYPHTVLDASSEGEGKLLVERLGISPDDLPLMVCPNGTVLKHPSNKEAAICLGITPTLDPSKTYDTAIVGAGPAGLAAAVYAASEGLSVIVLDERSVGGQAGASTRIENYLGFPTGISGQALTGRAFNQALKFGAEIAVPLEVVRLRCTAGVDDVLSLQLGDDAVIRARTVIVATGARYRRPDIRNLDDFDDAGVSYWASPIEAQLCAGEEVALVGGGNSAGQAVAFLAPRVRKLNLVVRRPLDQTMSRYLIDRIDALPNVDVHIGWEVVDLEGDRSRGLSAATFRNGSTGVTKRRELKHLFLFIGADPNTAWLKDCVTTDDRGFVLTGQQFDGVSELYGRAVLPLETSMPGAFAIGDVRSGSTKRVAAAVGDGAAVVAQIHSALAVALARGAVSKG